MQALPRRAFDWSFVNPKIGVTWQATSAWRAYASYGRNGREPARNDMFAGFDNLDTTNAEFVGDFAASGRSPFEISKPASHRAVRAARRSGQCVSMDFHNEISAIGPLSYLGLPLRKNVASSYRRGVEIDAAFRATARTHRHAQRDGESEPDRCLHR